MLMKSPRRYLMPRCYNIYICKHCVEDKYVCIFIYISRVICGIGNDSSID